jgi:predicted MFS family arabinose efflux permease
VPSQLRLIQLCSFAAAVDIFLLPPLVGELARHYGAGLPAAAAVAAAYLAAYGVMQLPWGLLSDRIGRVAALRLGLGLAACGTLAFALAPSLEWALAARLVAASAIAAVVPACIAWIGDTLPPEERARGASRMNAAYAAGIAAGTFGAGFLAEWVDWRVAAVLCAMLSLAALAASRGLAGGRPAASARGGLGAALGSPAVRAVSGFALVQGTVMFGAVTLLAPALIFSGSGATLAGLVVAAYGAAFAAFGPLSRAVLARLTPVAAIRAGGLVLASAWLLAALWPVPGVLVAAGIVAAFGASVSHSSMQVWATGAHPPARGAVVALFASLLFVGASAATQAGTLLLAASGPSLLFALLAGIAALHALAMSAARQRWPGG